MAGAGNSGGHGGAGSSGGQGRCNELRRPRQVQGAQEAMAVHARSSGGHGGAGSSEAMAVQGQAAMRQGSMAWVQGAQEAMVVAGSSGGHGRWSFMAVASARPLQPEPFYPPKKISLGKLGGIRSPPGLDRQDST